MQSQWLAEPSLKCQQGPSMSSSPKSFASLQSGPVPWLDVGQGGEWMDSQAVTCGTVRGKLASSWP